MRLSEFILDNMEDILSEWEAFAKTIISAKGMGKEQLRDRAEQILRAVADDIETPQSGKEQIQKSAGKKRGKTGPDESAESHGLDRLTEGFDLNELIAEFRALRASVIRLWTKELDHPDRGQLDEMTRFNEAIDRALTASLDRYNAKLNHSRDLLLGVLAHDLRNPLGAISGSSYYLLHSEGLGGESLKAAQRIERSSERMLRMISDLLDFTRTQLGTSLPTSKEAADMGKIASQACQEMQAYRPASSIELKCTGDLSGAWDSTRIVQMLSNLIGNAVEHGAKNGRVRVEVNDAGDHVTISVHNEGPAIPAVHLRTVFDPLFQVPESRPPGTSSNLGLGLYITQQIAMAHGGQIDVASSEASGTTFTVHLPRDQSQARMQQH